MINARCPLCGGEMTEASKGFSCANWKVEDGGCRFTIWKESYGASFSEADANKLLSGEVVRKTNISQAGRQYPADWYLAEDGSMKFDFVNM